MWGFCPQARRGAATGNFKKTRGMGRARGPKGDGYLGRLNNKRMGM
jgi:hypothetical protein